MGSLIDKDKLKAKAIEAINKNKLIFIEDICAMCGFSKFTFYEKFPIESNDYHELSKMLEENKISLKVGLRKKWFENDNPTTQMALYKLCSTDIEHKKLQQNYTDVTTQGESINVLSKDEIKAAQEKFFDEL
jgi:hypothetical protein